MGKTLLISSQLNGRSNLNKKQWVAPFVCVCAFMAHAKPEQTMYGNVRIHDASIMNAVKIIGSGSIKNAVLEDDVTVIGLLNAQDSRFLSDIRVVGSDLVLSSNYVEGDVHVTDYLHQPKLKLRGTTIVGSVIFHGIKDGVVEMDASSVIQKDIEKGRVK